MNKATKGNSAAQGNSQQSKPQSAVPAALQWLVLLLAVGILLLLSTVPLTLTQQLIFAAIAMGFSFLIRPENEKFRLRVMFLMVISAGVTSRYIYWRITESMGWFDPNVQLGFLDHFFSIGLLLAELYAWIVLYLGYIQSIWPLKRPVMPLPVQQSKWPTVDVYIPTYNEPLNVVIPSILAARDIEWPSDKLNVYVLDDGCRSEFADFAKRVGVRYIERQASEGAKAGNINNALKMTDSEYVAIFDCDHAPVRSFLKKTVGWFLRDNKLGLVQTPHLFFTPDPVERNLDVYHRIPNEGQLFYGLVQDGNDNWNAAFFCGSCAVIRRESLEEIGGVCTETVTEDAHTSLKMHQAGWNSAYLNIPLAAGLATEKLSQHIGQRRRWARGMTQIFRMDNPLFVRGLTMLQRLTYFNAMLHHLFSLPRLVFLTAPLAYLYFEINVIQATAALIAAYALPHIFQAQIANAAMQGRFRHSFWAEVYETILAPHIILPTLAALIAPNKGKFNVTDKGGVIEKDHFDWASSGFIFSLLILNLFGLAFGVMRYFYWNTYETDTVMLNFLWTIYNTIIIGAALAVAWEKRQRRKNPRIPREISAQVKTATGTLVTAVTRDLSISDMSLKLADTSGVKVNDFIDIYLQEKEHSYPYKARVATVIEQHVGVVFEDLTADQLSKLVYFSHGMEKSWTNWYLACDPAKPFKSFFEILKFGSLGVFRALFVRSGSSGNTHEPRYAAMGIFVVAIVLLAVGLVYPNMAKAQTIADSSGVQVYRTDTVKMTLQDLGAQQDINLRGGNTEDDVWFSIPSDVVPKGAELTLGFSLAPSLLDQYRALSISLNERELGSIPINESTTANAYRQTFAIDPLLVSSNNRLAFRLAAKDDQYCEQLNPHASDAKISAQSHVVLQLGKLNLVNDLGLFPVPFFDRKANKALDLPIVLPGSLFQSSQAQKAAAVMASWFGAQVKHLAANFPVTRDTVPDRHGVIFATPDNRPSFLQSLQIAGPGVAMVSHPAQSHVKFLVVTGRTDAELLDAVNTLVSGRVKLQGEQLVFNHIEQPGVREEYDAPRWLQTGKINQFSDLVAVDRLSAFGMSPKDISLNFRVPPDIYTRFGEGIPIKLGYSLNDMPLNDRSGLNVALNGEGLHRYSFSKNQEGQFRDSVKWVKNAAGNYDRVERFGLPYLKLAGNNNLSFYYDVSGVNEQGQCVNDYGGGAIGRVAPDSTIDLSGFKHYGRFPELAYFSNLGFPFTRNADLAKTVVVLPAQPSEYELQAMLNVMAKMGASTGLPAYHVEIANASTVDQYKTRDILVIGATQELAQHSAWSTLPLVHNGDHYSVRDLSLAEKLELAMSADRHDSIANVDEYLKVNGDTATVMSGMASPYDSSRNVVVLEAAKKSQLPAYASGLFNTYTMAHIHGDISINAGDETVNYRVFPAFYSGDLPWYTSFRLMLARHLLGLIVVFLAVAVIGALALHSIMERHAKRRIAGLA